MKLVNYDDLAKMPAGTVFRPYEPCILYEFHIKIEVPGYDPGVVCSTDIRKASLYAWLKDRDFVAKPYGGKIHTHPGNSDDCFMVINKQEVSGMIQILQNALNERKKPIDKRKKPPVELLAYGNMNWNPGEVPAVRLTRNEK